MRSETTIPRYLTEKVDRELDSGERIQWMDRPAPRYFTPSSIVMCLFAIPWTAFAVFWVFGAAGFKIPDFSEPTDFFPLFGVPFIVVGLGMLLSPVWTYRKSLRTLYAVTDRRAITFEGNTTRSYLPDKLGDTFRRERKNGSGDVVISKTESSNTRRGTHVSELGFFNIANPKQVEGLLKDLAEKERRAS